MSSEYIADYRNKAGECFARARTTRDSEVKMLWLALAERWQLLAEFVEKTEAQSAIKLGSDRDDRSKERAPSSRPDQQHQPSHADHHQQD